MGKPTEKMLSADAEEGILDPSSELIRRSKGEFAKVMFDEAPARLDGAEIGGVRGQEHEFSALGFNELADYRSVVLAKIIQNDNVAGVEARTEPLAKEVDEALGVDRAQEGLMRQDSVGPYGSNHREVLARPQRLRVEDALAAQGAAVVQGHRDVASRLVDEDQPSWVDAGHSGYERCALVPDVRAVLLRRTKPFFFQVKPALSRARCMAERLRFVPRRRCHSSQSSATVRSAFSATRAFNWPYSAAEIRGGKPPPWGSGSTSRVSRSRRSHRDTLASPIPNNSAICTYVPRPARYAATTRRRRSFEIGAAIGDLRSCHSDLRKRIPV